MKTQQELTASSPDTGDDDVEALQNRALIAEFSALLDKGLQVSVDYCSN